jgi:hypothetical protein
MGITKSMFDYILDDVYEDIVDINRRMDKVVKRINVLKESEHLNKIGQIKHSEVDSELLKLQTTLNGLLGNNVDSYKDEINALNNKINELTYLLKTNECEDDDTTYYHLSDFVKKVTIVKQLIYEIDVKFSTLLKDSVDLKEIRISYNNTVEYFGNTLSILLGDFDLDIYNIIDRVMVEEDLYETLDIIYETLMDINGTLINYLEKQLIVPSIEVIKYIEEVLTVVAYINDCIIVGQNLIMEEYKGDDVYEVLNYQIKMFDEVTTRYYDIVNRYKVSDIFELNMSDLISLLDMLSVIYYKLSAINSNLESIYNIKKG